MDWGKWIVVSFVAFAIFIGTLVVVCVRQDISLVATDYYKQELEYQKQIDRSNNAQALVVKPKISATPNTLQVSFSEFSHLQKGELKLFRPSNEASDLTFELKPTADSVLVFNVQGREKGMYKVQMKWLMNEKEYYMEETIYL